MTYQCENNIIDPDNAISLLKLCDGKRDCLNGDDETNFICDGW